MLGGDVILLNMAEFQFCNGCLASNGNFIQPAMAMDDQHVIRAKLAQYFCNDADQLNVKDTHELMLGARGVRKWAQDIEDGAYTEFFADRGNMLHGRMVVGRKHKANARLLNRLGDLCGRQMNIGAKGFQNVRTARSR